MRKFDIAYTAEIKILLKFIFNYFSIDIR